MNDNLDVSDAPLRLLFVMPFAPTRDAKHGGRVVAQLLGRLARRHEVALLNLRRPGSSPIDPDLAERCKLVKEFELRDRGPGSSPWRHRFNVLATTITGTPTSVAPLRDPRLERACVELDREWQPDIIQVEHDTLAFCGRALAGAGSATPRVLVCHEPGTLAAENQALVTGGRQRLAHRLDAAAWRRHWLRVCPTFDVVVTFTETDRDAVKRGIQGPRFAVIGLGIDIPEEPLDPIGHDERSVIFIGGYLHPPNSDAAMRLVQSIMPAVRRRVPGARLLIVGANPGRALIEAAGPDDTVTGMVPSVTPYVDRAALLALPLRIGGGMRVKLLEAMASGKAVVASSIAAAGIEATDGEQLVFAETDDEFAEAIVRLLTDPDARARLGHAARGWAERHLSWDARVERYEALYDSLLSRPVLETPSEPAAGRPV